VAAVDCCNNPSSDLELLVLGVLFQLGPGVSYQFVSTQTNISAEVHRRICLKFTEEIASIKSEYIFFPDNPTDLYNRIEKDNVALGLPGCACSIDCVHVGWDHCPAPLKNIYTRKSNHHTISYEVVSNHRRKIMSVTYGHPGKRNDKHISRLDEGVQS